MTQATPTMYGGITKAGFANGSTNYYGSGSSANNPAITASAEL